MRFPWRFSLRSVLAPRVALGAPASGRVAAPLFDADFRQKLQTLSIVSRRVASSGLRGERRSRQLGVGQEFADYRDYAPGDDVRAVDWNVFRRLGRLLVRQYEEQRDLGVHILLDCSASMGVGTGLKFAQARRLAAALAYIGLSALDRVTVLGFADGQVARFPMVRGKGNYLALERFFLGLQARGAGQLEAAARALIARHRQAGVVILISDLLDPEGVGRALDVLRFARFEPWVLHLASPEDAEAPGFGEMKLVDCETGEERIVVVTANVVAEAKRRVEALAQQAQHECRRRQVPWRTLDATLAIEEQVLQLLRAGSMLQ